MNGKAHRLAGVIAGPATGIGLAIKANRPVSGPEVFGWVAGGIGGAKLPDLLEPAVCPGHRKFAHSGTLLAANLAFLQSQTLESWIQLLKSKAAANRLQAQLDPQSALLHSIIAGFLEFLAGVLPAVLGGYASHLFCDATTPFGIPLC
jgi:membrane-bound metal-dependent hydrolase YbcI (DUF457 family)